MKKIVALVILCLIGITSLTAQNKRIVVSGNILDKEDKTPVEQATVQLLSLPDSAFVAGVVSLKNGHFTLPQVKVGKYVLKVSFVGYRTVTLPLQLVVTQATQNVGDVLLPSDAILLNEAVVVAEALQVVVVEDTTVYNTSAYRVPEGSMLEDLVKKLPGAEVSTEGKVTINGKEIKKIMVDGKEFFTDDPKLAMKNLPVNMIENVKAYDKKSDLARVTGIDDGEEEAVLDLTVKKGMKQGWFGNFIGGYGSKERYEAGLMANRFADDMQFSVIASANNTNNQGFSEFGDAGQGLGGNAGSGINASKSLGLNFAKDTKKFEVGGNISYGYSDRDAQMKSATENYLTDGSSFSNNTNSSRRMRDDLSANFRLEWRPDSMTNIIFRPSFSYSNTDNNSSNLSSTLDSQLDSINRKTARASGNNENLSAKGNLQVNRKLNSKGRNLTLRVNYNYNNATSDKYSYSETHLYKLDSIQILDRFSDGQSSSNSYRLQLAYTEPIFTNRFLQFGYSYQSKFSHSQKYEYNRNEQNYYSLENRIDSLSNESKNDYSTHEVNVSMRTIREKYMYNIGLNLEPQRSTTTTLVGPNAKGALSQNVLNYSPTIDFRYRFSKQQQLRLMYRGRSNAPDVDDLQEVKDVTDPMNLIYGNPQLKPSYSNRFMAFYNNYMPKTQRGIMANVSFSNTINGVTSRVSYNNETGGKISNLVNINGNWSTNGVFSFNTPFRNKKFTVSTYTNASYSNNVGYSRTVGESAEALKSITRSLNLFERLNSNYRNEVLEFGLSASLRYGLTRNNMQEKRDPETFDYVFGANTNINLPWNLYLSSDANYTLKSGYSNVFNANEFLWNAQVSKNFLKNKQATLRIKVYDILRQRSNLTRTSTFNGTTDTEYNTLNSYFMIHFVYRLNTFGGKRAGGKPMRNNFERHGGMHRMM